MKCKELTMKDFEEAMKFVEDCKPKCKICKTAFDSYMGILGYNCKCGCKKDAESPEGRNHITRLKRFFL